MLNIINSFIGNIQQIPPCFSAKKINGVRSYDLARQNKSIDLKPINVQIYSIDDIEYKYPIIKFTTKVVQILRILYKSYRIRKNLDNFVK